MEGKRTGAQLLVIFVMVAEQWCHGTPWVVALVVLAISACGEVAGEIHSVGFKALYCSQHLVEHANATTKFGASGDDAWVEHYLVKELYTKNPGEGDGELPVDEFEPNRRSEGCKASTYLQAQSKDEGCEAVSYSQVYDWRKARYVDFMDSTDSMEIVNAQVNLSKNDLMTLSRSLQEYVNEIMGYLDLVVHQLFIKSKTMCFAVLWLLQPHRSYCIATAGLVLQMASCLDGVAEGRIFQFTMFSMMVVCGVILMAVYMRRHVAKKEHVSRISKKRRRFRTNEMKKQLLVMMFIFNYSSASAMEAEAMAQRLAALTEAATRAAMSAEQMMTKMQSMSGGSSGASEGLSAASRILKPPDTFNGDDPMAFASWRFQFTSWLTFGDSRYTTLLERVEALTAPPAISTYDDGQKELAHKLYAVLTSYLRGRCSHIIKAFAKSRDGFAIWFQLMKEFEPTSRQRSLALAQALASYPVFSKDKSCLESILVYEQTVQQFEESSGTTYPDELKVATLMRCCNSKLREFLQLHLRDSSTYPEVKEQIMNHERVSKSWTQEQVLKAIQQDGSSRTDSGGPAPMEIDRIEHKGKGKSKNKGKEQKGGRGNGLDSMAWGFGRGRGKGNSKGKGKKGKGRGKGKGKNKGRVKARPRLDPISAPFALDMGTGQENVPEGWKLTKFSKPRLVHVNNSLDLLNLSSMSLTLVKLFNLLDHLDTNYQLLDLQLRLRAQGHHLRALLVQQ